MKYNILKLRFAEHNFRSYNFLAELAINIKYVICQNNFLESCSRVLKSTPTVETGRNSFNKIGKTIYFD